MFKDSPKAPKPAPDYSLKHRDINSLETIRHHLRPSDRAALAAREAMTDRKGEGGDRTRGLDLAAAYDGAQKKGSSRPTPSP